MAGWDDFSEDEWSTLRRALVGSAVLVSIVEGGKARDMMTEMLVVTDRLGIASRTHTSRLVRDLANIRHFNSGLAPGVRVAELEASTLQAVRAARLILARRAPHEIEPFSTFLIELAEAVANAHSEGGFMGFGSAKVSDVEAQTIAKIREALAPPA